MTIYIDNSFKVYTTPSDDRVAVETDAFDGMSSQVIECYIFVPKGQCYTKPSGMTVQGEFIQPWVTEKKLERAQQAYERQLLNEYKESLLELGVDII